MKVIVAVKLNKDGKEVILTSGKNEGKPDHFKFTPENWKRIQKDQAQGKRFKFVKEVDEKEDAGEARKDAPVAKKAKAAPVPEENAPLVSAEKEVKKMNKAELIAKVESLEGITPEQIESVKEGTNKELVAFIEGYVKPE